MNIQSVEEQTAILVSKGHRVLQIHRFAEDEFSHVSRLLKWADLPENAKLIDMGSGTGEVSIIFSEIRSDLDITLVNISPGQLAYSPQFKSHCCDFCNVPEEDGTFDSVMFCFSIGHAGLDDALKEAHRLLKIGGILFIYDMVRVSGTNEPMRNVDYEVPYREDFEMIASRYFTVDFYMEPHDSGKYGQYVLGDEFDKVFSGTIPAIWRLVK